MSGGYDYDVIFIVVSIFCAFICFIIYIIILMILMILMFFDTVFSLKLLHKKIISLKIFKLKN